MLVGFGRSVKRRWVHKVRSARGSWTCDTRAKRDHSQGFVGTNHSQVCKQSEQQQQGNSALGSVLDTPGNPSVWRPYPPSNRPLQVHSTVATIQVPTRLYSLYPKKRRRKKNQNNNTNLFRNRWDLRSIARPCHLDHNLFLRSYHRVSCSRHCITAYPRVCKPKQKAVL